MTPSAPLAIVSALRGGVVPAEGLETLATGLDPLLAVVAEELELVATGRGETKWIRGEYGTGKTFAARYLCERARKLGFATAEVQVSINDTPLHHLETVYRRLIERLETDAYGAHALRAIVDGWLYQLGEEVIRLKGLTEEDPEFATATEQRLEDKLAELSKRNPAFAQVLRAYHRASHEGNFAGAQGLLAWLAGQPHTDHSVLRQAGIKGKVDGQASLTFLAGLLQLLRQSGFRGLVVVLDEVETVQRMNAQTREKSLNALRQLMDMLAHGELPGLYLVVTGTRDFFEGYKGLRGLTPLHQRVHVSFQDDPRWDNLRERQVRLLPFSEERLFTVGQRVRAIYPAKDRARLDALCGDRFLRALVDKVTSGFGGKVAIAPRIFLRELVGVMDRVDQYPDYDPSAHYALSLDAATLTPEELAAKEGRVFVADEAEEPAAEPNDEVGTAPKADDEPAAKPPRRLDG